MVTVQFFSPKAGSGEGGANGRGGGHSNASYADNESGKDPGDNRGAKDSVLNANPDPISNPIPLTP